MEESTMRRLMAAGVMVAVAGVAQAGDDITGLDNFTAQAQFKRLSEDLGAALSYKAVSPAEPLGITGFDVGIEVSDTTLENKDIFDIACGGCGADSITIPKLHLHKGLPADFDVGLMYSSVPGSNMSLTGVELRYANMEGGMAAPAVATRLTYTKLTGVDQLDFQTMGVELGISKGFAMFTPYGGVGYNWVTSTPSDNVTALTGIKEETFNQTKFYVGLNMNLGLINFDIEADQTGDAQTYSGKVGFRF